MSAAETARMMPQLSAASVRQAMRWAGDERRLADASAAVLAFMRQHPIAATWGRSDLASSDMMSLETRQRVWQARIDPRRQEAFPAPSTNNLTLTTRSFRPRAPMTRRRNPDALGSGRPWPHELEGRRP
jgi:hypothetical protein